MRCWWKPSVQQKLLPKRSMSEVSHAAQCYVCYLATGIDVLISTWKEKGCSSLWRELHKFPLSSSHVVCWKACFVIHRTFRDGFKNVVKNTGKEMRYLSDLGKHWVSVLPSVCMCTLTPYHTGTVCVCTLTPYHTILTSYHTQSRAVAGYAPLITAYIRVLMSRVNFTIKVTHTHTHTHTHQYTTTNTESWDSC